MSSVAIVVAEVHPDIRQQWIKQRWGRDRKTEQIRRAGEEISDIVFRDGKYIVTPFDVQGANDCIATDFHRLTHLFLGGVIAPSGKQTPEQNAWIGTLDFLSGPNTRLKSAQLAMAHSVSIVPISWDALTNRNILTEVGERGLKGLAPPALEQMQPSDIARWATRQPSWRPS